MRTIRFIALFSSCVLVATTADAGWLFDRGSGDFGRWGNSCGSHGGYYHNESGSHGGYYHERGGSHGGYYQEGCGSHGGYYHNGCRDNDRYSCGSDGGYHASKSYWRDEVYRSNDYRTPADPK
ncbi:hypothetical protein Mal64_07610 [Pseudobythopirellula maris]|uniref:Uncharacterized protein n=1 Tax=Pseudobythopirellula maris TaxID=2527991 RepID=A0A5C5ZS63_9BACT|nr:hypothetical protein Mal64_07610 [Pseudobythopirellula maris]